MLAVFLIFEDVFKNVSSSKSHKKTGKLGNAGILAFFLSSTFIYKPIMIKIAINANIKMTHIFYQMKYDLKGLIRSNKAFYVYLFSSNNSSVKPTLPQIVCAFVNPIPIKREVGGSLFALWMLRRKLRLSMILKLGFMWPLLCYGEFARI
jgi:hypothetical protein